MKEKKRNKPPLTKRIASTIIVASAYLDAFEDQELPADTRLRSKYLAKPMTSPHRLMIWATSTLAWLEAEAEARIQKQKRRKRKRCRVCGWME